MSRRRLRPDAAEHLPIMVRQTVTYVGRRGVRRSAAPWILLVVVGAVLAYLVNVWLTGIWLTETGIFLAAFGLLWAVGMWTRYRG